MTCSNIGADILGSHVKPMSAYDKPSSNHKNSQSRSNRSSEDLIDSENVTDNSNSPRENTSTTNNHHHHRVSSRSPNSLSPGGGGHHSSATTPAHITTSSSSSSISFKPYENNHISSTNNNNHNAPKNNNNAQTTRSSPNNHHSNHVNHKNSDHRNRATSGDKHHDARKKSETGKDSPSSSRYSSSSHHTSSSAASLSSSSSEPKVVSATSGLPISSPSYTQATNASLEATAADILRSNSAYSAFMNQSHAHHLLSKAASAGVCRDPYCTGCHLTSAAAAAAAAAGLSGFPGMTSTSGSGGPFNPSHLLSSHAFHPGSYGASPFSSLTAGHPLSSTSTNGLHAGQSGAAGGGGKSFTCSWAANGSFCGKSFSTGDELLQHLKNHTSSSSASSGSSSHSAFGSAAAAAASLSAFGQYPAHLDPILSSPVAGLRRTAFDLSYRYHPYKPFGLNAGLTGSGLFNHHHAGLPPSSHPSHHHPVPGFTNGWRPDSVHSLR